jgi:hypothetical protein
LVSGKKWNGDSFLGVYEHEYDCGDHLVFDGEKRFCVHKKDCHQANEEEATIIKETILKNMKLAKKPKKKEVETEEELSEDELEEMLTEE